MGRRHLFHLVFVCLVVAVLVVPRVEAYGEPVSSRPSYQERTVGSLINAARVGPDGFTTAYMVPAGYPASGIASGAAAQLPLYFDPLLGQTSSGHSQDLATNCHAVQFDSCDGTAWYTRVRNVYTCSGLVGEGMQYAYSGDPLTAVNDGMCGWTQDASGNYACCPSSGSTSSGSACNGMRKTYLSSSYSRFGVGYGADAQTGLFYWTMDFGSCNTEAYANLIASGSHVLQSGNVRFFATYYDAVGAPQSAKVFVGGAPQDLTLDTGSANQGNYYALSTAGSACRSYYFQFTSASGGVYRYPETGYFNTYGEGSCDKDWTSTPEGETVATVPDPPQNVAVSSITASEATVTWSAPATDGGSAVTSYTVYIRVYGTEFSNDVSGATSIRFTGISSGTSCSVVVIARNSVGASANSTEATFITLVSDPTPTPTPASSASPSPSPASSASPTPSPSPSSGGVPACSSTSCLPAAFNFHTQTGCFAGILDQGQCGSCYSFCVASANADRVCWMQGARPVLSPQEILDCGKGFVWFGSTGCNGGDPYRAAQLVRDNGLPSASSTALSSGCRRYRCYNGNCDASPTCNSGCDDGSSAQKYKASSAYQVTGVDNTRLEIYNNGPVTAIFDVCQNFYDFYNDRSNAAKVYTGSCSSSSSDYAGGHAISVVGWGTDANGVDYWLIENSWSAQWADQGYFRMMRGTNQAGIEGYVSAAGFTRSNKRFGGVSAASSNSANTRAGAPIDVSGTEDVAIRSSQYALELWYLNAHKNAFSGKSLPLPTNTTATKRQAAAQPVGTLTTQSGYTVSSVNQATLQVTSGQSVFVNFVASNGAETVNLVATVSYGAAGGAASAAGVSVAASGGGAVLSTGAIIGIAVGGAVAVVLLAGVTAAVVVGAVAVYKRKQAHDAFDYGDHAVEMEAQGGSVPAPVAPAEAPRAKRSTWFERRKLFQSITGRSPPIRVDH